MKIYRNNNATLPYIAAYKKEIQLQAELYSLCKTIDGVQCILEYKHKNCRFDAVIVHNNKIVYIVEIKDRKTKKDLPITKQILKYNSFGVKVAYLINKEDIYRFFNYLKNEYTTKKPND